LNLRAEPSSSPVLADGWFWEMGENSHIKRMGCSSYYFGVKKSFGMSSSVKPQKTSVFLVHQSIQTPTLWVPWKGRGFDIDPCQKVSISPTPEARLQIKQPYHQGI